MLILDFKADFTPNLDHYALGTANLRRKATARGGDDKRTKGMIGGETEPVED
jgi:hypothetical protein